MHTQRINQLLLPWLIVCLVAVGLSGASAPARAADISWRSTSVRTSDQGNHYAYEGTAVFTTGEEGHLLGNGTRGDNSSPLPCAVLRSRPDDELHLPRPALDRAAGVARRSLTEWAGFDPGMASFYWWPGKDT